MTGRVLALVDGSTHSEGVCHYTAWMASRFRVGIDLLYALERREAVQGDPSEPRRVEAHTTFLDEPARRDAERVQLAQDKACAILDYACRTIERHGPAPIVQRLWHGDLLGNVAMFMAMFDAETRAVVIGKRGKTAGVLSRRLGSNVERIVRASRGPVLVAPRAFRPIARVIVAFDGSTGVERAVERMVRHRIFAGLEVVLVHAGTECPTMRERLDRAVRRLGMSGIAARVEVVPGKPEVVLGRKVEREGFDLLVMGAYSHSRLRNLIFGSTTTAVVQACRVPVLLYR